MKQFSERGLDKAGIRMIGPGDVMDDDLLPGMPDAALGAITAHMYSAAHHTTKNKSVRCRLARRRSARGPASSPSAAMTACIWIYQALEEDRRKVDGMRWSQR